MKKAYKWAILAVLACGLASCKVQETEVALPARKNGATVHFSAIPI